MMNRLRDVMLWIGAVLGVVCIAWTVAMFAFALTPLVFTSGSMSPEIKAGDLAFARTIDADQIHTGDIVSVENDKGVRITHRVVTVDPTDDGAVLSLKGDANATPDAEAYNVTTVERVWFSVPKAGYVVNAVGSSIGMFIGGLFVAAVLFMAFGRRGGSSPTGDAGAPSSSTPPTGEDEDSGNQGIAERARAAGTVGAAVVALAVAGTMAAVQPTQAAFSDSATMTTGAIAAAALPARSAAMTCAKSGNSATLTWSNAGNRNSYKYAYVVEVDNNASWSSPTRETLMPNQSATDHSFQVSSGFLGGLFGGTNAYVRVYAAYVDGSGNITWQSSDYRAYRLNVSFIFGTVTCNSSIA